VINIIKYKIKIEKPSGKEEIERETFSQKRRKKKGGNFLIC
jgi:hypothetical protein